MVLDREALQDDASVDLSELEPKARDVARVEVLERPRLKRDRHALPFRHDVVALGLAQAVEERPPRGGDFGRGHGVTKVPRGSGMLGIRTLDKLCGARLLWARAMTA